MPLPSVHKKSQPTAKNQASGGDRDLSKSKCKLTCFLCEYGLADVSTLSAKENPGKQLNSSAGGSKVAPRTGDKTSNVATK